MHTAAPAFAYSSGPRDARIALVGEAHGETEALEGKPFVGSSGRELTEMLREAGISREECFLTNVIASRPYVEHEHDVPTVLEGITIPSIAGFVPLSHTETIRTYTNDFDVLCCRKGETGEGYDLPPLKQGKYLRPEFTGELHRLAIELSTVKPNVTVALGGTATWALMRYGAISRVRGTCAHSLLAGAENLKVIPTYHPAYIMRVWKDRTVTLADLLKAKRESEYPEVRRPVRHVMVNPTLQDIREFFAWLIFGVDVTIACDIETYRGQIESIAFAPNATSAICVPFIRRSPLGSYWSTLREECEARGMCNDILSAQRIAKIFQNGLYDTQYLVREGFTLRNVAHDTMLMHHAMYPEMQKSLAFLGSVYTDEPAWKLMRRRHREEELKRDD